MSGGLTRRCERADSLSPLSCDVLTYQRLLMTRHVCIWDRPRPIMYSNSSPLPPRTLTSYTNCCMHWAATPDIGPKRLRPTGSKHETHPRISSYTHHCCRPRTSISAYGALHPPTLLDTNGPSQAQLIRNKSAINLRLSKSWGTEQNLITT